MKFTRFPVEGDVIVAAGDIVAFSITKNSLKYLLQSAYQEFKPSGKQLEIECWSRQSMSLRQCAYAIRESRHTKLRVCWFWFSIVDLLMYVLCTQQLCMSIAFSVFWCFCINDNL